MKWIGISGGWRKTNKYIEGYAEVERKVRGAVADAMERGDGIVSGGAIGVDFFALDEALQHDPEAERIKIFLPTTLERYAEHFRKHAKLGDFTEEACEALIRDLEELKRRNAAALEENRDGEFTEENKTKKYFERDSSVVEASDELLAFPVRTEASASAGTNDTIGKARAKGIPVRIFPFDFTKN